MYSYNEKMHSEPEYAQHGTRTKSVCEEDDKDIYDAAAPDATRVNDSEPITPIAELKRKREPVDDDVKCPERNVFIFQF